MSCESQPRYAKRIWVWERSAVPGGAAPKQELVEGVSGKIAAAEVAKSAAMICKRPRRPPALRRWLPNISAPRGRDDRQTT